MKMRTVLVLAVMAVMPLGATVLPESIGAWKRGDTQPAPAANERVWREYGLQESGQAPYSDGDRKFTIAAWRFSDATGAMAAFYDSKPADSKPAKLMGLAVENAEKTILAAGNYLFVFSGYQIKPEELSHVVATVPNYAYGPLPSLPKYMPVGADPASERYITGPESLARFLPSVPPATAGFRFNSEAHLARFGKTTLAIFSYPTMEMARNQLPEFQKVPGAVVKRTGPLLALVLDAPSPDDAERLLAKVKYQAAVTLPGHLPTPKDNPGNLFLNIAILVGVLASFCLVSGLVVGGLRVLLRRGGDSGEGDGMISLHLGGRH